MKHEHSCNCGTGKGSPHETGKDGCMRFMTSSPIPCEDDMWEVGHPDNVHKINNYNLRQQRGYHQHPCGCWSRQEGSTNSLPDET